MFRLIRELIRPYRGQLFIILLAMLVETAMSLAGPWPLKIIIDNVIGHHKMSPWLDHLVRPMLEGGGRLQVAGLAALAFVVIAVLGANRGPPARREGPHHAESRSPKWRERKSTIAPDAYRCRSRSAGQQPGLRYHT